MNIATLNQEERKAAHAARTSGVVCTLRHVALLEVRGSDAGRYLDAMCTRDLSGFDPGGLRYAALLDDRARLVADFWIWRVGMAWWLEVERRAAPSLLDRLNRFAVADDVEVAERTDLSLLHCEGPRAMDFANHFRKSGPTPEATGVVGGPLVVAWARRSRFGEEGFTFACTDEPLVGREGIKETGFPYATPAAQETLRLEAGRPRIGIDFGAKDLLPETGLWGALSLDKGCFPGQEIVRRIVSRGEVKRRLVGFVEEEAAAVEGAPELQVTSAAESVALGKHIGLGWVSADSVAPGTAVRLPEPLFGGRVAALPFVPGPQAAAPDVPGERMESTAPR